MPITLQNTALRTETEAPGETAEVLGAQVLALLPSLRLHSVSLFDAKGDVQWLSQGALGPDEQAVVEEAIATLSTATTRAHLEAALSDNRAALFLAVRTPRATLAGLVMVLMDAKTLSSGNLAARILTTSMRSVLQKIAMFLVPPPPLAATGNRTGIHPFGTGTRPLEVAVIPAVSAVDTANAALTDDSLDWQPATVTVRDVEVLEILEPVIAGDTDDVPATAVRFTSTDPDAGGQTLRLRELIRLRSGGQTRRYQVVPVAEQQRDDPPATLHQLLAWLRENPAALKGNPLSFTIGVSAKALADPELPLALSRVLAEAAQGPGTFGFELRESACVTQRKLAQRFLAQCEQSDCFAVIDDFTFHTAALDLLRSRAIRMLKVETRLVAAAPRDKLSQARVIAIAQAAKVLGTHCAAKYVDSPSSRRWLTAIGFDFTQSSAVEPLDRLIEPLSS